MEKQLTAALGPSRSRPGFRFTSKAPDSGMMPLPGRRATLACHEHLGGFAQESHRSNGVIDLYIFFFFSALSVRFCGCGKMVHRNALPYDPVEFLL